tara:strand:- start:10472 stop:10930 length:459 start_codon:yes stop_codon:yes gene_type:complete
MNNTYKAIIAIFVLGGLGFYWTARHASPEDTPASMQPAAPSALASNAPIVVVVVPAEFSADARMGQRGFEAKCASCHGMNAAGQTGVAPPLVHKTYEPNHHSDITFVLAAKNGVRAHHWQFGNMPPVEGVTNADVLLIARYIRELQKENGIF